MARVIEQVGCYDCHRPYGDEHGFPDLYGSQLGVESNLSYWEGGLLCPSCICKRLHDAKIECEGVFRSGPMAVR